MKLKEIKENEFQKCVNFWLREHGYSFTRGNQGFKSYWVKDSAGMPDLIVATKYGFKGVELKRENGKLHKEQEKIFGLVLKTKYTSFALFKPIDFFCKNEDHNHLQKKDNCWDCYGYLKDFLESE